MEPVLDEIFLEKDRTLLIVVPVAVIGITLIGVATYGQAVLMAFVGQRVIADLQSRVFAHILPLRPRLLPRHGVGPGWSRGSPTTST